MTKQDLEIEVRAAIRAAKVSGFIDREAMDFIEKAVNEKLERLEENLHVKRKDYIKALDERTKRMGDEDLGKFVKKTLWTVTEN